MFYTWQVFFFNPFIFPIYKTWSALLTSSVEYTLTDLVELYILWIVSRNFLFHKLFAEADVNIDLIFFLSFYSEIRYTLEYIGFISVESFNKNNI